ncbi:hypothetical protein ANN_16776 [Periplaneta americana]|uniref:Uncharacterized protein n=1 Tax=Periplaneta americana TaxID=6978 RepID=A0ABQ8SR22_PERAM|nr:hypothetical protein ANN_16776 [Periplaneta americana]
MGESRNAYRVLVGRPEEKRPLGRPRRRWEDNIKMDLREVGYDDREWINLAQDRDQWRVYVRAAMNLRDMGTARILILAIFLFTTDVCFSAPKKYEPTGSEFPVLLLIKNQIHSFRTSSEARWKRELGV